MSKLVRYPMYCWMIIGALLLSSCDGGLFGTGDGHNNDMMIEGTNSDNNGNPTQNPDMITGGTDTEADSQNTSDFSNLLPGSQISTPQLRVINLSNVELTINANDVASATFGTISTGEDSGRIDIPDGVSSLFFSINSEDVPSTLVQTFTSFNVAQFTLTTVIVRGTNDTTVDVIPLVTRATSTSPDTALVRLVQANELGDAARSTTISLIAVEPTNSGSNVSFPDLSYTSTSTEYNDVIPGSYALTDSANRFSDENINIEAGEVYTLIISKANAPVLRVIVDSD